MKHPLFRFALGASLALSLGACTTVVRTPGVRVVARDMPPPVVEVAPAPPAVGYSWVPGHWAWRGNDWRWVQGHYVAMTVTPMPAPLREEVVLAPSPAHVWVRGHWVWRERGWVWVRGAWVTR